METIKIAHLYYDLMNLNGENGNLIALKKHFEYQGLKVEIYFLTLEDHIDFNRFDIYYMGAGSIDNKLIALKDLMKYKKDIKKAINNNKYFFMTGNSYELFGSKIINLDHSETPCLNTFDYYTEVFTDEFDYKIVGDYICKCQMIDEDVIGFQNRFDKILNNKYPLFEVLRGEDIEEGFNYLNFYGTFLLGPLFIRNPSLTDYFVKEILQEKSIPFKENKDTLEYKAYKEYLKNFVTK